MVIVAKCSPNQAPQILPRIKASAVNNRPLSMDLGIRAETAAVPAREAVERSNMVLKYSARALSLSNWAACSLPCAIPASSTIALAKICKASSGSLTGA